MKTILKLLSVATLTVFFFSQSFAQTTAKSGTDNAATGTAVQGKFVDKNNDGICDNHATKGKASQCANFVDKDGNGVCDNCANSAGCCKKGNCQGKGHENGTGCGQGTANCGGAGHCQGKGQGKCCQNKQEPPSATPSETPDPKK